MLCPRSTTSPISPCGSSSIRSSISGAAISASVPQIARPTVPGLRPKTGWLNVATGEVSDSP